MSPAGRPPLDEIDGLPPWAGAGAGAAPPRAAPRRLQEMGAACAGRDPTRRPPPSVRKTHGGFTRRRQTTCPWEVSRVTNGLRRAGPAGALGCYPVPSVAGGALPDRRLAAVSPSLQRPRATFPRIPLQRPSTAASSLPMSEL